MGRGLMGGQKTRHGMSRVFELATRTAASPPTISSKYRELFYSIGGGDARIEPGSTTLFSVKDGRGREILFFLYRLIELIISREIIKRIMCSPSNE